MELGKRIKHYRTENALSQDNLAERIYVSRQTISNWENDKSYPDINSIILLSEVFGVSIDNLIKGDVEQMKLEINNDDVNKMNVYAWGMSAFFLLAVVSFSPLYKYMGIYAFIPFIGLFAIAMFFAMKIEKIKKDNDVHTYKEIVAFNEGKGLDEIKRIEEKAKRPYQKVFLALGSGMIAILICGIMAIIFKLF